MKRNQSIEVYRCLLMLGIVLLHVICQGGYCQRGLDRILLSCVDGFVFISGYYGIRFSIGKVISLIFVGAWCSLVTMLFGLKINDVLQVITIRSYFDFLCSFWFLWAYIVLMLFAPSLEVVFQALQKDRRRMMQVFSPLLFLVFGWMYLTQIPGVKAFVPRPAGFGVLTFLCLLGIYIAARLFRCLNLESYINRRIIVMGISVCSIMAWIGFGHYHSIFALGLACLTFCAFKRTVFPPWIGSLACYIAPSMFSVYLLHSNGIGFAYCKALDFYFIEHCHLPVYCTWFLTALIVFVVCLLLDYLRRILLLSCRYLFRRFRQWR